MPLHLQHHKSYHPYNKDNIERVRRDEEAARTAEEAQGEQRTLIDSEARLDLLRKQRKRKHEYEDSGHADDRIRAAEAESSGRRDVLSDFDNQDDKAKASSSAVRVHDIPVRTAKTTGNAEYEAERRRDKDRSDEQITMFLGKPVKELHPWYGNADLQSGTERKKSQEQRLEDAYKDGVRKRNHDPMRSMPYALPFRNAASDARQQHAVNHVVNEASAPSHQGDNDPRERARRREEAEQARVEALMQTRRKARNGEETPVSTHEYNDQYNRNDVRAAHDRRQHSNHHRVPLGDTLEKDFWAGAGTSEVDEHQRGFIVDSPGATNTPKMPTATEETSHQMRERGDETDAGNNEVGSTPVLISRRSDSTESMSSTDSKGRPRESMYPQIFGEMIDTVLEHESYLFTEAEQGLLQTFSNMDYEARHLLARLIQRRNCWHRVDKLNYDFDVTDKTTAVLTLCKRNSRVAGMLNTEESEPTKNQRSDAIDRFCLSEQDMEDGFEEALSLLTLDELKTLAKNMNKHKGLTSKASIITALLSTRSQGTLHGFAGNAAVAAAKRSQAAVLREQLNVVVGGCVRVCPRAQSLIDRMALVYYRGSEQGGSALTTAVLSRSRKRTYPQYAWKRSAMLFASRSHLIDMQRALNLEVQMDQWIEWDGSRDAIAKAMSAFEEVFEDWKAAVNEGERMAPDAHDLSVYNRMRFHPGWPLTRVVYKGCYVLGRLHKHEQEADVLRSLLAQRAFRRGRRGDWYDRLALITAHYPPSNTANAIRKAKRDALAISVQGIEDSDTHLIYHDTLQRRITRLENQLNLPFSERHDFSYAKLRTCEDRVFRGVRLDKMMCERKGIFGATVPLLADAQRSSMLRDTSASNLGGDSFTYRAPLRKIVKVERMPVTAISSETDEHPSTATAASEVPAERREIRKDMHSVWRGLDGEPCQVEALVLQHYATAGYRGFHCEGGILTMLFALLMWDILFMPIDGVFETPYQRQPLDLTEDTFAIVRGPEIRRRLMEIENTGGLHLVRETDERERARKTWALGCRWDDYGAEELVEIAECMGGKALSVVCQMLAEEWSHCTAGMPDLCVWRYADKQVRFCEVKGPGDKLSDKQKLWIDVLLRAGLHVEVSKVEEA